MSRTLKSQIIHSLSENKHFGESKHSAMKNGTYQNGNIYSVKTYEAYKDTAKNLANYLKEKHHEIKNPQDIKSNHIQEWINDKGKNWTAKTLENKICHIKYIEQNLKKTYHGKNISFYKKDFERPETKQSTRNKAFTRDDLDRL